MSDPKSKKSPEKLGSGDQFDPQEVLGKLREELYKDKNLTDEEKAKIEKQLEFFEACMPTKDDDLSQYPKQMPIEEFSQLADSLQDAHALFHTMWVVGQPILTTSIPTAAVVFSKDQGNALQFIFNPFFWRNLEFKEKRWVIAHEILHVVLKHGFRAKDTKRPSDSNVAQDVVINHMLDKDFNIPKDSIRFADQFCWMDTVFTDKDGNPSKDWKGNDIIPDEKRSFEYYFNLLQDMDRPQIQQIIIKIRYAMGQGGKQGPSSPGGQFDTGFDGILVDDHSGFSGQGDGEEIDDGVGGGDAKDGTDKAIDNANDMMTPDDKKDIEGVIEKHSEDSYVRMDDGTLIIHRNTSTKNRGTDQGNGVFQFPKNIKIRPIIKWKEIIRRWVNKNRHVLGDTDQWIKPNRRFSAITANMPLRDQLSIPSEGEDSDGENENRIRAWMFMDTSGSCTSYAARFWRVAESIPKKYFDLSLFCFDTKIYRCNLVDKKLFGFGGTYFSIMEQWIQQECVDKGKRYPDAVFVLTDGYGDDISTPHPEKWYFFMTEENYLTHVPKGARIFKLSEMEDNADVIK